MMSASQRDRPRVKVVDLELSAPLPILTDLDGYGSVKALVWVQGNPMGFVDLDITDEGTLADYSTARISELLRRAQGGSRAEDPASTSPDALYGVGAVDGRRGSPSTSNGGPWPSMTVAVCTRGRSKDLSECLGSLLAVDYPDLEILVVDNAPTDDESAAVCAGHPSVRYVVEPRPGLNWARNRAVLEASTHLLVFTDDDVRVCPGWARTLARAFLDDPTVMAVAGLVIPLELETPAQLLFEEYGGLSGGFRPMKMRGGPEWGFRGMWHYALAAQHGSGANMAFRRSVFARVGLFDPALDVGTVTNGGGDTEMLFRVMAEGHGMAYEPRAVVRHRHRRKVQELRRQISGWGSGTYAWLTRSVVAYPRAWWVIGLLGLRGLLHQALRLARPGSRLRWLALAELRGSLAGPFLYFRARRTARGLEKEWGRQVPGSTSGSP